MVQNTGAADPSVVEQRVEEVWRDVLGMPEGGQHLTFFELHGQSISAVRIVGRLEDELGVTVDFGLLFEDPDLATFTKAVVALTT
ncbi:phosphopantetheine-binding protein [Dactylosporangium sp. NPDC006015]|uniref:phosphopantetheine-binding protein n=1 Tax=Dactylosporangium sp. NPDC006015 TaxID=3154576 RepID=UPI0033A62DC5